MPGAGMMAPLSSAVGTGAVLKQCLGRGQFGARVDAERFGLGAGHEPGRQPAVIGDGDDVGKIVFALGVIGADRVDEGKQRIGPGRHDTGIAQCHRQFVRGCVLGLDDAGNRVAPGDQAAIAAGVGGLETQNHQIGAIGAGGKHPGDRVFGDERGIAIEHHRIAIKAFQRGARLGGGMGGAFLLGLDDNLGPVVEIRGRLRDQIGAVTGHDHDPVGIGRGAGPHGVVEHGRIADRVQDLGQVRFHPRAFAGGEYDQGGWHDMSLCCWRFGAR